MKNFVCITDASGSVVTVPLATSKPKSLRAFVCKKVYPNTQNYDTVHRIKELRITALKIIREANKSHKSI